MIAKKWVTAFPYLMALFFAAALNGCASTPFDPETCPTGTQKLPDCPPVHAVQDPEIAEQYDSRSHDFAERAGFDPIAYARTVDIPVVDGSAKFIGSTNEGALEAIASKIWMVENAEHTIDMVYFIYTEELVGLGLFGAMCDAVERGVDVRVLIDSVGAKIDKDYMRALESCALGGEFIRNRDGEETVHKARAQAVIFNTSTSKANRRLHEKIIIKDGAFGEKAYAITGGRNMGLDYYGFHEDGSFNKKIYRDANIIVRGTSDLADGETGIGEVTEAYFTTMFTFEGNKRITMRSSKDPYEKYREEREFLRENLAKLKALPQVSKHLNMMGEFMTTGFSETPLLVAHNLQNITNKNVVSEAVENLAGSPNSIVGILDRIRGMYNKHVRIVSPYMFAALYEDDDGNVVVDEAQQILDWLEVHPDSEITMVTNSVITGDNIFTQSVVDLDMVPRLLLSEELSEQWSEGLVKGEENPELVESEAWIRAVNHPRLHIYETGRLDDARFGGDKHYSKLHAKYIVGDSVGFVGSSNFDYRSRLYNSEMGYFFDTEELVQSIIDNTDYLISISYRWGSPEWLEMRRQLRELDGTKASAARHQRGIYKTIKETGLLWLF